jgi:hypothetical protein
MHILHKLRGTHRKDNSVERSETWKMHIELAAMKMKSWDCMLAWVMQGHNQMGMEKEKRSINLVETIKSLKRYVLSYKANNERLMKYQRNKMDSTSICCRAWIDRFDEVKGSRSHVKKEESRSVGRHNHHSPRHSVRRDRK